MSLAAQKTVASLMQKALDRQAAQVRMKFKLKEKQVEQIIGNYISNGKIGPYNELIKIIKEYPLTDENFRMLLQDSLSCVVLLSRELKQYVDVMCSIEWLHRSEDLMILYRRFILNLVTAHTYHCPKVMIGLVKLFKADGDNWNDNPPDDILDNWSNIHTIIAQIVSVMPMSSNLLMEIVVEQFPYYKASCFSNRAYVYNLIWITKYIPSLREQILSAIINRMVIMDVNVVDQMKKGNQHETIFDMDNTDEASVKLDYCMVEVLRWLEDERDSVFDSMCNVFEKIILPTYGIRHVQFLLLFTISINQQCADRVLNNLWSVAAGLHGLGPGAIATRRTAASHLAGLLARCVRIPNTRLTKYLKLMAEWCHAYITATQETTSTDNNKVHGAFQAICHAIFYLVAFKHHHLFGSKESVNFVESLNLPRLVTCTLNPLRTCPTQVQRAFSSVTRSHQLVYCASIIERNTRQSLQHEEIQCQDWFPYDPYTLPVSGETIWPLCTEYKDWPKDGDDESQYSSMKRKLEDDDDFLMAASPSQKLASSLSSFISPGFRTSESLVV